MITPQTTQTRSWTPPEQPVETREVLYLRYHAYRRRQAAQLLHVIPREAVRDLYARAREWAKERGLHDGRDPMASLKKFAEELLPLPTFEVWLADRERFPLCHLEDYTESAHAPRVSRPGKVEEREIGRDGRRWIGSLNVFREGDVWRGFIRFRERGKTQRYHTANIFREDSATEIRRRFREFDREALGAFLLSVLP